MHPREGAAKDHKKLMRVKSVLNFLKKRWNCAYITSLMMPKEGIKRLQQFVRRPRRTSSLKPNMPIFVSLQLIVNAMKLFGNLARILMRHTYTNSSSCKHLCLSLALLKFLIFRFKLYTSGIIFVHKCPTELTQFLTLSRSRVNMRKISKNAHLCSHI